MHNVYDNTAPADLVRDVLDALDPREVSMGTEFEGNPYDPRDESYSIKMSARRRAEDVSDESLEQLRRLSSEYTSKMTLHVDEDRVLVVIK
jgi:hypothetical protein